VVTGGLSSASLLHTTDGGRHWQRQLRGTAANRWSLWFFDARRGVVAGVDRSGPALWSTMDGGQRWARTSMTCLALPPLVFFLDLDHGWCVERPGGEAMGVIPIPDHQQVALLRTADGGVHWTQVLATDQAHALSGGLGDDGQKAWIWFRDANTGWIGQHSPGGHAVVSATVDGGDHWNRQGLVTLMGQYVYTWQAPAWAGPLSTPAGPVLVADPGRWLAANGSSVLETSDRGQSWTALGAVPRGWVVARLTMVDSSDGWAVVHSAGPSGAMQSELARTTDGGRHWDLIIVPS
jgi:photosystem II stability/assembly factor-like uncharacterized protein